MKNRDIINGLDNKKFVQFISHMDCSCCAYYADSDMEPAYVCAKQHERMNDPEAASRICSDGMEKWLDLEDDWQLLNM